MFYQSRADSRLAPSQETSLQSNAVSHWQGANLESALSAGQSTQIPPTSDTIQLGMTRLAIAKRSAARNRAPEITLSLSIDGILMSIDLRTYKDKSGLNWSIHTISLWWYSHLISHRKGCASTVHHNKSGTEQFLVIIGFVTQQCREMCATS